MGSLGFRPRQVELQIRLIYISDRWRNGEQCPEIGRNSLVLEAAIPNRNVGAGQPLLTSFRVANKLHLKYRDAGQQKIYTQKGQKPGIISGYLFNI